MSESERPRDLLAKVVKRLRDPVPFAKGEAGSILATTGAQYNSAHIDDHEESTQPTGFDPLAAVLFEAVVESAYLVATADGTFDDAERSAFEHVVLEACGGKVSEAQLRALLADLSDLREEDGPEKRVQMVARTITRPDQAKEVLRVAALIAEVSQGVSDVERSILDQMASAFRVEPGAVDGAIAEAQRLLAE
jgi:tellurite resistance protein